MLNTIEQDARVLYDGGWRAKNRGELILQYELGEGEADALVRELKKLEASTKKRISIDNGSTFITPAEAVKSMDWDAIVNAMDDEVREKVHAELAPCTNTEFLNRYLELASEDLIVG